MKPLRFLHIQKTAGTTFANILHHHYIGLDPENISFRMTSNVSNNLNNYSELSESDKSKIALFIGHSPITTGIDKADKATTITIIRDPINRVKSFCQHVSEGKSPHLVERFPPETFSLDEFLASRNGELNNLQTNLLVNNATCNPTLFSTLSATEAIDLAIDNLFNKITCFGLQEYFDESLILFSLALNWDMPLYTSINKKNISKLIKFEERHIQRIKELNLLDIEVYKIAKERFISLLDSDGFDKKKLKHFQHLNASQNKPAKNHSQPKRHLLQR